MLEVFAAVCTEQAKRTAKLLYQAVLLFSNLNAPYNNLASAPKPQVGHTLYPDIQFSITNKDIRG
jgi:hypothetical protein